MWKKMKRIPVWSDEPCEFRIEVNGAGGSGAKIKHFPIQHAILEQIERDNNRLKPVYSELDKMVIEMKKPAVQKAFEKVSADAIATLTPFVLETDLIAVHAAVQDAVLKIRLDLEDDRRGISPINRATLDAFGKKVFGSFSRTKKSNGKGAR